MAQMAEHQDRNKVYIFKKTEDQPPSDYAYRRDWSRYANLSGS